MESPKVTDEVLLERIRSAIEILTCDPELYELNRVENDRFLAQLEARAQEVVRRQAR